VNTLEPFSFSIDWGNALVDSLIWVARAWAIAAIITMTVLVLIAKFTIWGRQFWTVTGAYFTGPHSVRPWLSLSAMLLSVIIGVRLSVLFSYQSRDLYSAAQAAVQGFATGEEAVKDSGINGFWVSLALFALLAAILVTRVMVDLFITQSFMLAWRTWLTHRLTGDWLDGRAYYRGRFIDKTIDNPDQRIQADVDVFTALSGPQPNTHTRPATAHCRSARSRRSCRSSRSPEYCGTSPATSRCSVSKYRARCSGRCSSTSLSPR
jgi:vitamin B12/bleomycin/antimicrobial peptide transport system ATP-binding/permease protein